jgi:hypothetical protein
MEPDLQNEKELNDIIRSLGKIEGTLSLILISLEKQNGRVSKLEAKVNWAAGALAVVSAVFTFGWDFLKGMFR